MKKHLTRANTSFVFAIIISLLIGHAVVTEGILLAGRGNGLETIHLSDDPQIFKIVLVFYAIALLFLLLSGLGHRAAKKRKKAQELQEA